MDLFDLTKMMFDRNSKWSSVKPYDKVKNFFMINRFMSINFPMKANLFNNRHITSSSAIDSWRDVVNRLFTKTPNWLYTKTKKNEKQKQKKFPERETVMTFMKLNNMSQKDFGLLMENFQAETIEELLQFEKILKEKNTG